MNYSKIIIDGYNERRTQQTSYVSYFKGEAQIAKRGVTDFFEGCKLAIDRYKNHIKSQYNKRLTENDWVLKNCYSAIERGEVIDKKGESIQSHIDYIEGVKAFVMAEGYEKNYFCLTTEMGEITESVYDMKYKLYYSDINQLEQAITQAEKELTQSPESDRHSSIEISPIINRFIPKLVNEKYRSELEHVFSYGKVNKIRIDWKGTHGDMFNKLKPLFDDETIPHLHSSDWVNFVIKNFTKRGEDINKKSVQNELSRANWL